MFCECTQCDPVTYQPVSLNDQKKARYPFCPIHGQLSLLTTPPSVSTTAGAPTLPNARKFMTPELWNYGHPYRTIPSPDGANFDYILPPVATTPWDSAPGRFLFFTTLLFSLPPVKDSDKKVSQYTNYGACADPRCPQKKYIDDLMKTGWFNGLIKDGVLLHAQRGDHAAATAFFKGLRDKQLGITPPIAPTPSVSKKTASSKGSPSEVAPVVKPPISKPSPPSKPAKLFSEVLFVSIDMFLHMIYSYLGFWEPPIRHWEEAVRPPK